MPCADVPAAASESFARHTQVAEALSIPAIGVVISSEPLPSLQPVDSLHVPDTRQSHPGHKDGEGKFVGADTSERNSWRLASVMDTVNEVLYVRREMGLPLAVDQDTGHCICYAAPLRWLVAASALLPPLPALDVAGFGDVLADSLVTGAWQLPCARSPHAPSAGAAAHGVQEMELERVEAFLRGGPAPVYVSFAGVAVVSSKMLWCVVTALAALGLGAIFDGILSLIASARLCLCVSLCLPSFPSLALSLPPPPPHFSLSFSLVFSPSISRSTLVRHFLTLLDICRQAYENL